jgi:hypothetical protein
MFDGNLSYLAMMTDLSLDKSMTLAVDLSNDKSVKILKYVVDETIEDIDQ